MEHGVPETSLKSWFKRTWNTTVIAPIKTGTHSSWRNRTLVRLKPMHFQCIVVSPKKVDDRAELDNIKLGFPVHFVIQNSSSLAIGEPDSPWFPYRLGFISPWEYPARFLQNNFLLSVVMTYAITRLLFRFRKKIPKMFHRSQP